MAILTQQPFKGIYLLSAIGWEVLSLPVYALKFVLSSGRQHPDWTFRQSFGVQLVRKALAHLARIQFAPSHTLQAGREKERWVTIKTADSTRYVGPLRINKDIQPEETGGTWYPAPLSQGSIKSDVKLLFHIHGGAFTVGDGRTASNGYFAKKILKHTPVTHLFLPQYRLSKLPVSKTSNPFPAALQDCLTAYLYIVDDLKIATENIVISGDSAGGNLAIALLKYIEEFGSDLGIPKPAGAVLMSPWINPSDTSCSYTYDNKNYVSDYLTPPFTRWGTDAYGGLAGEPLLSHAYVTFKNRPYKTSVPVHVNTGSGEILYFEDVEWVKDMTEAGNDIDLYVEEGVPHDIMAMAHILGFDKECTNGVKKIGEWWSSKM